MWRISLLLFFISLSSIGQNFVPNPSFELYSSCPIGTGQINLAVPWTDPTVSSSDYFNSCSASPNAGSPNNFAFAGGGQFPRSGNGYGGFLAFASSGREYVQIQLLDSLTIGIIYRLDFYVSLGNFNKYAIDAVGAYLSSTPITGPINSILNYTPQVENVSGNYLGDTLNWMQISGTFIASGGEKHITIGDFKSVALTNRIVVNPSAYDTTGSYYYIDDVAVYPDSG